MVANIKQEFQYAERKLIAILKVLSESSKSLGSVIIARRLEQEGVFLSERAVRYHLKIADEKGYTRPFGIDGRMLTSKGLQEVSEALVPQQLGFLINKLEMLAYQSTFNPEKRSGEISINTSLIYKDDFKKVISVIGEIFQAGICVSDLVAVAREGERLGSVIVPEGQIGFATVSSVAVIGTLLKAGIPSKLRFGGMFEVRNSNPMRFVAVIDYSGTWVNPSEQFIRSKMTSVGEVSKTGNGKVVGDFLTIPAPARDVAASSISLLKKAGITGVCTVGRTSEPVCRIPVSLNQIGVVQFGGLNPFATGRR